MKPLLPAIAASILISGCATMVEPQPGKITLEEALSSVGRGLVELKKSQLTANDGKEFRSGLLPSEAEVTFNISASGEQSGKLFVEITKTPADASLKKGAELGSSYTASRGNQITVKFRNIAFSKTTKLEDRVIIEGVTDPDMLVKVVKALEGTGITINAVPSTSQ